MRKAETIIIGGGVSGMACGKTLHEHGQDFLLLTKEVGGRMLTSQSHKVNYGASYVTEDYRNIWPYMGGGKRIRIRDCFFLNGKRLTTFYCLRTLRSLPQLLRLYFIVRDFRRRLRRLRTRALHEPQKALLAADPVLTGYAKESAREFVKRYNLEDLNTVFFGPLFNSTGFVEYDKCNAFAYLDVLMAVFCRTYVADHSRCCHLLTRGWEKKICIATVNSLQKTKGGYVVSTSAGTYHAQNVVLALPYKDAQRFCAVPKPTHNVPVYVLEVLGTRKLVYRGKPIVFFQPKGHSITILWKQETGTDILFSKAAYPKLERYYDNHKIIKKIYWPTACVLSGSNWCKQDFGNGLYLASDYNICGLEDSFITGVYAANRIMKQAP
ncbi:NAD(P)-dependent oxidoreductase [Candidatus Woesearchaeota archaeon]|nr:NAD(P)-dependent oxidoreductase [Candidatus Woesearchaeota archaeon]